ncbi:hypothetical protein DICPUDRAFT_74307 [Dictyostelium purpureum]|uniref:Uncharacterized protein n=1 Tax=Dictyostelium purpureum TaxID=5786 RepID=F0Z7C7_DICPU|nr:uncharacterized protein DICPUDRAFT_74307 [Dictyostelium purpureum]EGC40154.1 hypothetical protein DICPUDRAFT_74307 [Dictyostelium purpureum]|eukprot:XP_003283344.1 hypothetical protein DICPUDRAFT_74307 [Dictyostelium purpureum]
MDAIVTKMEETLERKKSIANIVEKRTMVIDYIRRIHEAAYYGNSGFSSTPSSLSISEKEKTNNSNNNSNNNIANNTNTNNTLTTTATNNTSGLSTSSSASSISSLNTSNSGNNLNKLYQQESGGLSPSPPQSQSNISCSSPPVTPFQLFPNHNMHWMNVTMVQRQDFEKSQEIQKRLLGWFCLGFSLAPLIATDKGPAYIRSLVQLMEEYDYHFELGSAMQGVKVLLSKKQQSHTVVNENEHIKSKIVKIGTTVVYEFLKIFNISIAKDLDYFQVVFSLLEILEQIYRKIDKETCSSKYVYEALLKVDSRLKHNVFGFLSKEIDKMSMNIIKEQLDFTLLSTSIKDKDIQQHLNIQSKLANSLNTSTSGISKDNGSFD